MNVLLATNSSLDLGGISTFMLQWIRGIKEAYPDGKVAVYFRECVKSRESERKYIEQGVDIYTGNIPIGVSYKNAKANRKVKNDISKILKSEKYDVIHINSRYFAFHVLLLSEAKRHNVPIRISHFHGSLTEGLIDKMIHSLLRMQIRALATVYAGCSKPGSTYLFGKKGVKSEKWMFVPNTIQTDKFAFDEKKRIEKRKSIGVNESDILLGAVGRMDSGKNHIFLVELVGSLRSREMNVKLIILGDGGERLNLQNKVNELKLADAVILYGLTDDVSGWLSAMDYYMMPSLSEGFPISVVEAQANGLVCLLSDRITKEADLSKDVYHISIDNGTEPWIKVIESVDPVSFQKRNNGSAIVIRAGFDERDTPMYVRALYERA